MQLPKGPGCPRPRFSSAVGLLPIWEDLPVWTTHHLSPTLSGRQVRDGSWEPGLGEHLPPF